MVACRFHAFRYVDVALALAAVLWALHLNVARYIVTNIFAFHYVCRHEPNGSRESSNEYVVQHIVKRHIGMQAFN